MPRRRIEPTPVYLAKPPSVPGHQMEEPPYIKRARARLEAERQEHDHAPLVYARGGPHSYFRDRVDVQLRRDPEGVAQARLEEHGRQAQSHPAFKEVRAALSTTDGTGGYFALPLWLEQDFVPLARPLRPVADLAQNFVLPRGTNQLTIPRLATGTGVGAQASGGSQNAAVTETDLTDAAIVCPVISVSGQQQISQPLLDLAHEFDDFIIEDLAAAYSANIDSQILSGTGSSGTLTGIINTAGVSTVTPITSSVSDFYAALGDAMNLVLTNRNRSADAIVMAPRRFSWLCQQEDSTGRPLFTPHPPRPVANVAQENVAAELFNIPVIVDQNVPTTSGGSGDYVFVLRTKDLALWESPLQSRISQTTYANQLTVLISAWRYAAFAVRYASSCVLVGPFSAPNLTPGS
jgi:HK97 family phage major capsid protein